MTRQDPRDPRAGTRSGSSRSPSGTTAPPRRGLAPSSLWADEPGRPAPEPLRASWEPLPPERPPTQRDRRKNQVRRRSWFGWFVHRYGWRVYAIPLLAALTVFAVLQISRVPAPSTAAGSESGSAGQTPSVVTQTVATTLGGTPTVLTTVSAVTTTVTASPTGASSSAPVDPNTSWAKNLTMGALPPGGAFTAKGKGTWHVVKGSTKKIGAGPTVYTYTVEVEDGLQGASADQDFATRVDSALSDPRSWIAGGDISMQRVDKGEPDFRISLTSQLTIRDPGYCGYDIPLEASCYNRAVGRVLINGARWERGSVSYNGDLALYRVYAINHEVGHALGHGHEPCAVNGGLAPVMMQQSFSTANDDLHPLDPNIPADGKVCRVNPYPYPMAQDTAAPSTQPSAAGSAAAATTE